MGCFSSKKDRRLMWKLVKIPSIMVNTFLMGKGVWFSPIIFWFLSNLRQSLESTRTHPQWPVSSFSTWRCVQLWNHPFWNCNSWFTLQHVWGLVSSGYVFCTNLWNMKRKLLWRNKWQEGEEILSSEISKT